MKQHLYKNETATSAGVATPHQEAVGVGISRLHEIMPKEGNGEID